MQSAPRNTDTQNSTQRTEHAVKAASGESARQHFPEAVESLPGENMLRFLDPRKKNVNS